MAAGAAARHILFDGAPVVVTAETHGLRMRSIKRKAGLFLVVKPEIFAQDAPALGRMAEAAVLWEFLVGDDGTPFAFVPPMPVVGPG